MPRFCYLDGELEIMTHSAEHERIKKWIGDLLGDYLFELGENIVPRGNTTMHLQLMEAGAEPDESWCIGEEKRFPTLCWRLL